MFWIILQVVITYITLSSIWLAGNKNPKAWVLGIINQFLWILLMQIHLGLWLLSPIPLALLCINIRNYLKWKEEGL